MSIEACGDSSDLAWEGADTEPKAGPATELLRDLMRPVFPSDCSCSFSTASPIGTSTAAFENDLHTQFRNTADFVAAVLAEREAIAAQKEFWRSRCTVSLQMDACERIEPSSCGTYLVLGENRAPEKVVKPADEAIWGMNNPTFAALPLRAPMAGLDFPYYDTPNRETAAYAFSEALGFDLVPHTEVGIVTSEQFYDVSLRFSGEIGKALEAIGHGDTEKFCSVRDYVPHAQNLYEFAEQNDLTFAPADVDAVHILTWITGNTDCNPGNILVFPKATGGPAGDWGLKLIDQTMAFPKTNLDLGSSLRAYFDQERPLLEESRALIASLPVEKLASLLHRYDLACSIDAMRERIEMVQKMVAENKTIEEIDEFFWDLGAADTASWVKA